MEPGRASVTSSSSPASTREQRPEGTTPARRRGLDFEEGAQGAARPSGSGAGAFGSTSSPSPSPYKGGRPSRDGSVPVEHRSWSDLKRIIESSQGRSSAGWATLILDEDEWIAEERESPRASPSEVRDDSVVICSPPPNAQEAPEGRLDLIDTYPRSIHPDALFIFDRVLAGALPGIEAQSLVNSPSDRPKEWAPACGVFGDIDDEGVYTRLVGIFDNYGGYLPIDVEKDPEDPENSLVYVAKSRLDEGATLWRRNAPGSRHLGAAPWEVTPSPDKAKVSPVRSGLKPRKGQPRWTGKDLRRAGQRRLGLETKDFK